MRKSLSFYGRDRGPMGCAEGAMLGFTKHCPNELRGHMDAELLCCVACRPRLPRESPPPNARTRHDRLPLPTPASWRWCPTTA